MQFPNVKITLTETQMMKVIDEFGAKEFGEGGSEDYERWQAAWNWVECCLLGVRR